MGIVGVGSHAYRNILPALHYLPVSLVAMCDLNAELLAQTAAEYSGVATFAAVWRALPRYGGGRGGCRAADVETMRSGVCNVLRHLKMLPGDLLAPPIFAVRVRGGLDPQPGDGVVGRAGDAGRNGRS